MKAREFLLKNWGLKLTALFLAFILWLMVHGDLGTERNIMVPVEIRIPQNMVITNEDRPSFVEVSIRGPLASGGFGQPSLLCLIDLQTAQEGERLVPIGPQSIQTRTAGLEILTVRPTRLRLVLEREISKEVRINPNVGTADAGFEVYEVRVSPSTALVKGPRSRLDGSMRSPQRPYRCRDEQESIRRLVNLNIKDSQVHTSPAESVEVEIEIGPRRNLQTISPVPVLPDDASVTVQPVPGYAPDPGPGQYAKEPDAGRFFGYGRSEKPESHPGLRESQACCHLYQSSRSGHSHQRNRPVAGYRVQNGQELGWARRKIGPPLSSLVPWQIPGRLVRNSGLELLAGKEECGALGELTET